MSKTELFGVVVFGAQKVGKTSLITQFVDGTFNNDQYNVSIGVQMYVKHGFHVDTQKDSPPVDYKIMEATDTGCFYARRDWVYRRMSVIVVAYSITDSSSFRTAKDILELARSGESKAKVYLVGLMADLEEQRVVSTAEGEELARGYGVDCWELSAADALRVSELFRDVARWLPMKDKGKEETSSSEELGVLNKIWKAIVSW
ncbi:small GTPase superfamily [Aspergillus lucknowensis]|uniref:Small GTPase superfamily n=1 Tax=Aspergillus lucknowensis TaxID=176173 RepID=A0ABR4M1M9_9EURO